MNQIFRFVPYLQFKEKKGEFQNKRYIICSGDTIYLMKCMGINEFNVLKMKMESYYQDGIITYFEDHYVYMKDSHFIDCSVYEMYSQKEKIQNDMEKRALHTIIRKYIEYFEWY